MILVIGSQGGMGKRYCSILDYLKEDYLVSDLADGRPWPHPQEFDKAIVAVPTDQHFIICKQLIEMHKDILVEKPVSTHMEDIKALKTMTETGYRKGADWVPACDFRVVNNLYHAMNTALTRQCTKGATAIMGEMTINYDHYHSGRDGLAWDACQLIYMAHPDKITLKSKSPVLDLSINGYQISLDDVAESYVVMLSQWINGPEQLWGLTEALKMDRKVNEYLANNSK